MYYINLYPSMRAIDRERPALTKPTLTVVHNLCFSQHKELCISLAYCLKYSEMSTAHSSPNFEIEPKLVSKMSEQLNAHSPMSTTQVLLLSEDTLLEFRPWTSVTEHRVVYPTAWLFLPRIRADRGWSWRLRSWSSSDTKTESGGRLCASVGRHLQGRWLALYDLL